MVGKMGIGITSYEFELPIPVVKHSLKCCTLFALRKSSGFVGLISIYPFLIPYLWTKFPKVTVPKCVLSIFIPWYPVRNF